MMRQTSGGLDLEDIIDVPPFSLARRERAALLVDVLNDLTQHHFDNCVQYRKILDVLRFDPGIKHDINDIPAIPVRLFKNYDLRSVDESQIIKTMTSSGTSGQSVSRIFLDRMTSRNQTKVLTKIVSSFIGTKRLPMLIIDSRSAVRDRKLFSARGAGILGFSMFGYDVTYALDEQMQLDLDRVDEFCEKHKNEKVLLFGFTFMVWEYLYKRLDVSAKRLALENGIMIHGGGWKRLKEEAIDNDTFKRSLQRVCGIERVYNYYGMVEQTGSIFMECEVGNLHSSIFSDVAVLEPDFSECGTYQAGLMKLSSLLPFSYPGHIILTEDTGAILGEDDCSCGRLGKYFQIHGRARDAEVRGCSDTYESA